MIVTSPMPEKTPVNWKKVTVRDLCQVVPWEDVEKSLHYFYEADKGKYKSTFLKIKKMARKTVKGEELELNCSGSWWFDENLKDAMEAQTYDISTNKYSLSFQPWDRVANIPISERTITSYMFADIISHFLWEITFYGGEAGMKKTGDALKKTVKDVKKELADKKKIGAKSGRKALDKENKL